MGKAKRKLAEARKECYEEIEIENEFEEEIEEEIEVNTEQFDLSIEIQQEMLRYTNENMLSLCEYLIPERVDKFIEMLFT